MGRAFEFRKERKFKRWGHMARVFTKIGKEITIAVKQGGPDVTGNPRLRALLQSDYKEVNFEGYGPHGVAFLIEAATDNNNRTVANIRSYFTKSGGSLGTSGSTEYMFDHKCVFRMKSGKPVDIDELELELIDYGAEEVFEEVDEDDNKTIVIYGEYTAFNNIQKYIEDNGYELVSGEFTRIPNVELKDLPADQRTELDKLIERLEEDDDVQNVYHTMKVEDEE